MDVTALAAVDSALLQACLHGKVDELSLALNIGADALRARDAMGATTLHMGAVGGSLEVVKWCLKQGVSPAQADAQGVLPLHAACYSGNLAIVEVLAGGEEKNATERRRKRAASMTAIDAQGGTPLHHAALGGRCNVARWLLYHGADERYVTVDGLNAERVALEAGEMAMVRLLRSYTKYRKTIDPDRVKDLPPPFLPATSAERMVVMPQPLPPLPTPVAASSGLPPPPPPSNVDIFPVHQGPSSIPTSTTTTQKNEDDDGYNDEERQALAEAEKEAEQFRQAETQRLIAEEDARRKAEAEEAAARLVAAEQAQRERDEKQRIAQRARNEATDNKKAAADGDDWLKRYQLEVARREAERCAVEVVRKEAVVSLEESKRDEDKKEEEEEHGVDASIDDPPSPPPEIQDVEPQEGEDSPQRLLPQGKEDRRERDEEDRSRRRRRRSPKRSRRHRSDRSDSEEERSSRRRRPRHSRHRRRHRARDEDSPSPSYRDVPHVRRARQRRGLSPASRSAMKQLAEAAKAGAIKTTDETGGTGLLNGAMAMYPSFFKRNG